MDQKIEVGMNVSAEVEAAHAMGLPIKMKSTYHFEAFDSEGNKKWEEIADNLVTNAGLNELLDKFFKGSSYTAAFYVGLINNASFSAIAAADTASSHAGWTESTDYSESNRQTLTLGSVASQSVDNSASKASFTINATVTIKGAFLITNNTKGGTTGILYGAVAFGANRSLVSGDILRITVTLTAASA